MAPIDVPRSQGGQLGVVGEHKNNSVFSTTLHDYSLRISFGNRPPTT